MLTRKRWSIESPLRNQLRVLINTHACQNIRSIRANIKSDGVVKLKVTAMVVNQKIHLYVLFRATKFTFISRLTTVSREAKKKQAVRNK